MSLHGRASRLHADIDRSRGAEPLPEDCLRKSRRHPAPRGEMRLALAVLEDALRCLRADRTRQTFLPHGVAREAERWIESTDRGPLFSFEGVCLILGLDDTHLRGWIRRWRAGQQSASIRRTARSPRPDGRILHFPSRGDRRSVHRSNDVLRGDIIQLDL